MRRYDAVIFDMDGVLIDSEPIHFDVLSALLAEAGHTYTRADNEEFIGTTTEAMFTTLIARDRLPGTLEEWIGRYDAGILHALEEPHDPAPGVVALIQECRDRQMPLGVASSSRRAWIDATLRSIGLAGAFDAIVSGDDVTHSKPDPQIYLLAAERLAIAPDRCLAIEDSPNGVESARAAGMTVLGVRTPYTAHLPLPGAHHVVSSLADNLDPFF